MKLWNKAAALAAVVVAFSVVSAPQAFAKGEFIEWNSRANPLTVSGYGSTGYSYGRFRVADSSAGTRAFDDGWVKLSNADNHRVYITQATLVNSGSCIAPSFLSCTQQYYVQDRAESPHDNRTGAWLSAKSSTGVDDVADYARGAMRTCLDIPLRTDPCSGQTLTAGTQY
ncbi:hypothetical protein ABLG96_12220 [Nakamurella sp. A5-74]|uniref:Secreted protein n=1 Tax=Nakamurella sp. A5-74 TaxID=3158264 RepID=A0AAU8DIQ2_9ACTN